MAGQYRVRIATLSMRTVVKEYNTAGTSDLLDQVGTLRVIFILNLLVICEARVLGGMAEAVKAILL